LLVCFAAAWVLWRRWTRRKGAGLKQGKPPLSLFRIDLGADAPVALVSPAAAAAAHKVDLRAPGGQGEALHDASRLIGALQCTGGSPALSSPPMQLNYPETVEIAHRPAPLLAAPSAKGTTDVVQAPPYRSPPVLHAADAEVIDEHIAPAAYRSAPRPPTCNDDAQDVATASAADSAADGPDDDDSDADLGI
jgi:hypothetical protein